MEMIFLIAPPSLLWPDGIRERSEAVKANTSKRRKREGGECKRGVGRMGRGEEKNEVEEDGKSRKTKLVSCG